MITVDSSSLILLAKIGHLDTMIASLKKRPVIPQRVYEESIAKKDTFDAKLIKKRVEEKQITVKHIKNLKIYNKLYKDFNLGKGEAEAITLCLENNIGLITDDKKAFNTCKILQVSFTTVPNIIVRLCKTHKITKTEALLAINKLKAYGRYSDQILSKMEGELHHEKNG